MEPLPELGPPKPPPYKKIAIGVGVVFGVLVLGSLLPDTPRTTSVPIQPKPPPVAVAEPTPPAAIEQSKISRELIGNWIDALIGYSTTFFSQDGKVFMETKFRDGSSDVKEMILKTFLEGNRYEEKEKSETGDYYTIDKEGNLLTWDREGFISKTLALKNIPSFPEPFKPESLIGTKYTRPYSDWVMAEFGNPETLKGTNGSLWIAYFPKGDFTIVTNKESDNVLNAATGKRPRMDSGDDTLDNLAAKAYIKDGKIVVVNENTFRWRHLKLVLNDTGIFTQKGYTYTWKGLGFGQLAPGKSISIAPSQFTKTDGTRFNTNTTKILKLDIYAENPDEHLRIITMVWSN